MKLTGTIRQAIETCGQSRYRIAQETGVLESTLSRLMAGHRVSSDTLDVLAEHFGMKLTKPRTRRKGR